MINKWKTLFLSFLLVLAFGLLGEAKSKGNKELARSSSKHKSYKKSPLKSNNKAETFNCDDMFIDPYTGEIGDWGNIFLSYLNRIEKSSFNQSSFLRFKSLIQTYMDSCSLNNNDEIKKKSLLLFSELAKQESSCRPYLVNNNSKKPGWGLFTLERKANHRAGRSNNCQGDITSVVDQIQCTIDIFIETPRYWQDLNSGKVPKRAKSKMVCSKNLSTKS